MILSYDRAHLHIYTRAILLSKPESEQNVVTRSRTRQNMCLMARPWPYLFTCWQTYYQQALQKMTFSCNWENACIFMFDQIGRTNLLWPVSWSLDNFVYERNFFHWHVTCQPRYFWGQFATKYSVYLLRMYRTYQLPTARNNSSNTICSQICHLTDVRTLGPRHITVFGLYNRECT